ncbi:YqjD family protein [Paracoccus sp. SCSIO 75233]|uniref:DUF883 family protein n=1 Tax=Paracoccus sp. SCSIO 75233 TaxID=3017782 RepID=UPI0022F09215|nr:DUF883 domain-containing protein [Paracoccus sp. SCSIO 75233]WBU54353.1 DUF883 domain-containing protein [Paracoccus sp. SCSIO 75233]
MASNEYSANDLKADAKEAARDVGYEARETLDTARQRGEELAGRAQQVAQNAREKAGEYADSARELGREYADVARDEARRLYHEGERRAADVAAQAEDYYDDVSDMVRRNPAQALGIAAGIGFLVGLMIARR